MQLKSLISAVALATALGLAGPAAAQVTINEMEVPEDELGLVLQQCLDLQALETAEPSQASSEGSDSEDDSEGDDEAGATLPAESSTIDGTENAELSIDLNSLTLEQCEESGIFDNEAAANAAAGAGAGANTGGNATTNTTNNMTTGGDAGAGGNVNGSEDTEGGELTEEDAANTGDEESTGESDAPVAR